MNNINLLPADKYKVVNKTILTSEDHKNLISLYEPIIGSNAVSLYITLWRDLEKYKNLSLDHEMITALSQAAKRGIDVRILTPHHGDKWYVHGVTRANYWALVDDGVKIYEYTPGFVHAKTFVVDDEYAVVGTINLDYRSLYLHYECAAWLYKTKSVLDVRDDYLETLKVSQKITSADFNMIPWYRKIMFAFLRIFAPLM